MATRQKVYSSLKDTKYDILKRISEQYSVSESEIIRTVMERVLGNRRYESKLIHEVFKDLVDDDKGITFDDEPVMDSIEDNFNIPKVCPKCGEKEDVAGNSVILVNRATKTWSCSICFASGGI